MNSLFIFDSSTGKPRLSGLLNKTRAIAGALALASLAACSGTGGLSSSKSFELRGATEEAVSGWTKSTNSDMPGSVIYLSPNAIVTAADVQRANAQKDAAGRAILLLQFSPSGTARLTAGSRELVGRQIAVVIDGRVTNVAKVQGPMTVNTMAVTGFSSLEQAADVAHRIGGGK